MTSFKRILVPVDGSETSNLALSTALALARESGGRVRAFHALDELAYLSNFEYSRQVADSARKQARQVLDDAMAAARSAHVEADTALVEKPGQRLGDDVAEQARAWEADLVVVGTHGRRGIGRILLGSGAEQILRAAPVPVLTVRATAP